LRPTRFGDPLSMDDDGKSVMSSTTLSTAGRAYRAISLLLRRPPVVRPTRVGRPCSSHARLWSAEPSCPTILVGSLDRSAGIATPRQTTTSRHTPHPRHRDHRRAVLPGVRLFNRVSRPPSTSVGRFYRVWGGEAQIKEMKEGRRIGYGWTVAVPRRAGVVRGHFASGLERHVEKHVGGAGARLVERLKAPPIPPHQ